MSAHGPESIIERQLVAFCYKHGLRCYKFVSPANRGVPDRMILGHGNVLFMELKRWGQKPTALQLWEMKRIQASGHTAVWADSAPEAIRLTAEFFGINQKTK